MKVEFFVPGKLVNPLNGSLSRAHWTKKSEWASEWKHTARLVVLASNLGYVETHLPKRVTFTAHVAKLWDTDNLPAGIKPCRDALIGRIYHSDAPKSGHVFEYAQVIDGRRGVTVTVEMTTPATGERAEEGAG